MLLEQSKSILAANIILPIFAIAAVYFRFIAQRVRRLSFQKDDYVILVALILSTAICVVGAYGAAAGIFGSPTEFTDPNSYTFFVYVTFIDVFLCHLIYGLIKVSVLLFYKRIFITPRFRMVANIMIIVVTVWTALATIGNVLLAIFLLKWFDKTPTAPDKKEKYAQYIVSIAATDIALDLIALSLPIPVIKSLQTTARRKVQLSVIFLLGSFCVISSGVRLSYTKGLLDSLLDGPSAVDESTYVATQNDLWAHIEACASIVTVCLPTLAPLFRDSRLGKCIVNSAKRVRSVSSNTMSSIGKSIRPPRRGPSRNSTDAPQTWLELDSVPRAVGGTWASTLRKGRVEEGGRGGGSRGGGGSRDRHWVV